MLTVSEFDAPLEMLGGAHAAAQDLFVARQPIFDVNKHVHGYELLCRGGLENFCPDGDPTEAAQDVLQAAWLAFGFPALIGNRKAFVNFTRDLLLGGYATTLPTDSTVIELLETIDGDADVVEACRNLKRLGYLLALDDFAYRPELEPLIELADIVKIDFSESDPRSRVDHVRRLAPHGPQLVAEAVETEAAYQEAAELGCHYFQGYFFCKPQVVTTRALKGTRLTYLRLLQCVTRPELVIDELQAIVEADASVTHRLMKYLGSAAFGFRSEIRSIRHALVLMGKTQIRQWVSLVALGEIGSEKPHELLVQAAVRGKFCERLSEDGPLADRAPELFLVGVLSPVSAMLDQPKSEVVATLPLAEDIRLALLGEPSPLQPMLAFVEAYERADWTSCDRLGLDLRLTRTSIPEHYRDAVSWATDALGR